MGAHAVSVCGKSSRLLSMARARAPVSRTWWDASAWPRLAQRGCGRIPLPSLPRSELKET